MKTSATALSRKPKAKKKPRAKPQRWPFVTRRVYASGVVAWMVDARTKVGGERRSFATREAADTFAEQCRVRRENDGLAAFGHEELASFGKTVQDAIAFYLVHLRQRQRSISVQQAVNELLGSRQACGMSTAYCQTLSHRCRRFARTFGERLVDSLTTQELDQWLSGLGVGPVSRNNYRCDTRTLLSFCVKRGYAAANPVMGTETAKVIDKPVGILSVDSASRLLRACSPEAVPVVAIGLFAGVRVAELAKLDWSEIDLEVGLIEIRAHKAKTRRRRLVTIEPVLGAWLRPHWKASGPIATAAAKAQLKQARRIAGFGIAGQESAEEKAAGIELQPWPSNVLRHSFGSYWLAHRPDVAALALQMGNTPAVIFAHYRELVRPADAARFWALLPSAVETDAEATAPMTGAQVQAEAEAQAA
jgi:integrase